MAKQCQKGHMHGMVCLKVGFFIYCLYCLYVSAPNSIWYTVLQTSLKTALIQTTQENFHEFKT